MHDDAEGSTVVGARGRWHYHGSSIFGTTTTIIYIYKYINLAAKLGNMPFAALLFHMDLDLETIFPI